MMARAKAISDGQKRSQPRDNAKVYRNGEWSCRLIFPPTLDRKSARFQECQKAVKRLRLTGVSDCPFSPLGQCADRLRWESASWLYPDKRPSVRIILPSSMEIPGTLSDISLPFHPGELGWKGSFISATRVKCIKTQARLREAQIRAKPVLPQLAGVRNDCG
jgi:hypothetical protein